MDLKPQYGWSSIVQYFPVVAILKKNIVDITDSDLAVISNIDIRQY